jgi:hypothetical protein
MHISFVCNLIFYNIIIISKLLHESMLWLYQILFFLHINLWCWCHVISTFIHLQAYRGIVDIEWHVGYFTLRCLNHSTILSIELLMQMDLVSFFNDYILKTCVVVGSFMIIDYFLVLWIHPIHLSLHILPFHVSWTLITFWSLFAILVQCYAIKIIWTLGSTISFYVACWTCLYLMNVRILLWSQLS